MDEFDTIFGVIGITVIINYILSTIKYIAIILAPIYLFKINKKMKEQNKSLEMILNQLQKQESNELKIIEALIDNK